MAGYEYGATNEGICEITRRSVSLKLQITSRRSYGFGRVEWKESNDLIHLALVSHGNAMCAGNEDPRATKRTDEPDRM